MPSYILYFSKFIPLTNHINILYKIDQFQVAIKSSINNTIVLIFKNLYPSIITVA